MSNSGGSAALKGFRLQTLYILHRVLSAQLEDCFCPEGEEDLDLHSSGGPAEFIQVKAYTADLTLQKLTEHTAKKKNKPNAEPPFLQRALKRIRQDGSLQTLVSFGRVGPELRAAWDAPGVDRDSVTSKLLAKGYSQADIDLIFSHVRLVEVHAIDLLNEARSYIQNHILAGSPDYAMDVLSQWILGHSERQTTFTTKDFLEHLTRYGQNSVDVQNFHAAWQTTLHPLTADEARQHTVTHLQSEFYRGVDARFDHIVQGVDVVREHHLEALQELLSTQNLVFITGASGQGKSTLAYRYLHDHCPRGFTFEIRHVENLGELRTVTSAIRALVLKFEMPVCLYLDIKPGQQNWVEFLSELTSMHNVHLLITLREEDWNRQASRITRSLHGRLQLDFNQQEAEHLYGQITQHRPATRHLGFEDAWQEFGGKGPLLEFVFVLNHVSSLRARLEEQVDLLHREWNNDSHRLAYFHAASIATAYHARVDLVELGKGLGLNRRDAQLIVGRLKDEYLLRVTEDGQHLEGLHHVRSQLLADILALGDPELVSEAVLLVFPAVSPTHLEMFLLHAFVEIKNPEVLLEQVHKSTTEKWEVFAQVLRALQWWDIRTHLHRHLPYLERARGVLGKAGIMFFQWNIVDLRDKRVEEAVDIFLDLDMASEAWKHEIRLLKRDKPQEVAAFEHGKRWLQTLPIQPLQSPQTAVDWAAFAEVGFWSGFWEEHPLYPLILQVDLKPVELLPLYLALDVYFALSHLPGAPGDPCREQLRQHLHQQFLELGDILELKLQPEEHALEMHFVVPDGEDPLKFDEEPESDLTHEATTRRLAVLRKLYPEYTNTRSFGYGHQSPFTDPDHDPTQFHGDSHSWMPPHWAVHWNRVFLDLFQYLHLKDTWEEYFQALHEHRKALLAFYQDTVTILTQLQKGPFSGDTHKTFSNEARWLWQHFPREDDLGDLPRCALDRWGLMGRIPRSTHNPYEDVLFLRVSQHAPGKHRSFLSAHRDHHGSLFNFVHQMAHGLEAVGLMKSTRNRELHLKWQLQLKELFRQLHLARFNLSDLIKRLPRYQQEYRNRFLQYLPDQELSELERQEQEVLGKLWTSWTTLARPQGKGGKRSTDEVVEYQKNRLKQLMVELHKKVDFVNASVLDHDHPLAEESTLWIGCQIEHPVHEVFAVQVAYLTLIRFLISLPPEVDVLMAHQWQRVAVVVHQNHMVWKDRVFSVPMGLLYQEANLEKAFLYQGLPVSREVLEEMGFELTMSKHDEVLQQANLTLLQALLEAARLDDLTRYPISDNALMLRKREEAEGRLEELHLKFEQLLIPVANEFSLALAQPTPGLFEGYVQLGLKVFEELQVPLTHSLTQQHLAAQFTLYLLWQEENHRVLLDHQLNVLEGLLEDVNHQLKRLEMELGESGPEDEGSNLAG